MTAVTFHTDPGHAWLEVNQPMLSLAGLTAKSFSRYSYTDRRAPTGVRYYLEEDCDAYIFIKAWESKYPADPLTFSEKYTDYDSRIRRLPRL